MTGVTDPGSFRDPAGFVFRREGVLYRQVNRSYAPTFDRLEKTGFLRQLQHDDLLIRHEQLGPEYGSTADALTVLRPEVVPFISYSYEWCFGELRDAALQLVGGYPVFIDSLSFGIYTEGQPWQAYGQFCEHFLAPLALMTEHDPRLAAIQRSFSDGIPLEIASRLLGMKTWLRPGLMLHIHAHAKSRAHFAHHAGTPRDRTLSLAALRRLVDHLRRIIEELRLDPGRTPWADYETEHNYTPEAATEKREAVREMLARLKPATVWDLGANTGVFSAAAPEGARVVAIDGDHAAVERHYQRVRQKSRSILPLVMDLSNPSPARGWAHAERKSLAERGPADAVLALALIHHLVLGGGVPLASVAKWLSGLTRFAIVEFVPPDDEQVLRLTAGRTEPTHPYSESDFRRAFEHCFSLLETRAVPNSGRVLYLFEKTPAGN